MKPHEQRAETSDTDQELLRKARERAREAHPDVAIPKRYENYARDFELSVENVKFPLETDYSNEEKKIKTDTEMSLAYGALLVRLQAAARDVAELLGADNAAVREVREVVERFKHDGQVKMADDYFNLIEDILGEHPSNAALELGRKLKLELAHTVELGSDEHAAESETLETASVAIARGEGVKREAASVIREVVYVGSLYNVQREAILKAKQALKEIARIIRREGAYEAERGQQAV
ncbi:MAG: hypothetical protein AAB633_01865 [Patescibacteria group bacterium]